MTESRTSQESTQLDPFGLWRQMYEANEQVWTRAMKDVISSQGFAEAQGKMLETILAYQKVMRDLVTAQLNALNMPTRDDVSRVGELITVLEEKVDQLEDRLVDLDNRMAGVGEQVVGVGGQIVGLGDRLAGLDNRMVGLGNQVVGLGDRLAGLDSRVAGLGDRIVGLDSRVVGLGDRLLGMDTRIIGLDERLARRTHIADQDSQAHGAPEVVPARPSRPAAGRTQSAVESPGSSRTEKTE